jgi:hypothetical protein
MSDTTELPVRPKTITFWDMKQRHFPGMGMRPLQGGLQEAFWDSRPASSSPAAVAHGQVADNPTLQEHRAAGSPLESSPRPKISQANKQNPNTAIELSNIIPALPLSLLSKKKTVPEPLQRSFGCSI